MVECEFKLIERGSSPKGKLTLKDEKGVIEWKYVSHEQRKTLCGEVQPDKYDYVLVSREKPLGRLKNFSLYQYNPRINYLLKFEDHDYRCEVSDL